MGFPEDAGLEENIKAKEEEHIFIVSGFQTKHGIAKDSKRPIKGEDGVVDQWIFGVAKKEEDILSACKGHPFMFLAHIVRAVKQPFGEINLNPAPDQEIFFKVIGRPDPYTDSTYNPDKYVLERISSLGF